MAGVKREEIESNIAVAEVVKADAKVEEIKAKKAADKAKKHSERLEKHPKIGKIVNWMDDHKWSIVAAVATGGASAAGTAGYFIWKKKTDPRAQAGEKLVDEAERAGWTVESINNTDTGFHFDPESEMMPEEPPFNTEA